VRRDDRVRERARGSLDWGGAAAPESLRAVLRGARAVRSRHAGEPPRREPGIDRPEAARAGAGARDRPGRVAARRDRRRPHRGRGAGRGRDRRLFRELGRMTVLAVEQLFAHHGLLQAVRDVTFTVDEGETVALVGANGAGKTTLLRAIAGAHRPAAGFVRFDGDDLTRVPAHRRVGRGIVLVPEGRRLFPGLTVEENLLVGVQRGRPGRWT